MRALTAPGTVASAVSYDERIQVASFRTRATARSTIVLTCSLCRPTVLVAAKAMRIRTIADSC